MARKAVGEVERLAEGAVAGGGIEIVFDGMAVASPPRAGAEHAPAHGANARLGQFVAPALARASEIAQRRHAAAQRLRDGDAQRRAGIARIDLEDRHEFVERTLAEAGRTQFLQHSLPSRLVAGMGVNIDEARHDHLSPRVDDVVGFALIALADMRNGVAAHGEIDIAQIDMGFRLRVPAHQPVA